MADAATAPVAGDESDRLAAAPGPKPGANRSELGLLAVAAAFLLPVAFSPLLYYSYWAPKAAVCLVLLGPGLVALARLVAARSTAAVLAALFLAAASASTLLADNTAMALIGAANWGTGLVFVAVLVAAWALGATAGEARRRQVEMAIVAAALLNAVVAWLQARGWVPPDLESAGRSQGLMGNSAHLGALVAGALWLVARRTGRERGTLWWTPAVALLAGAAQVSGQRSAVALAAVALLASARRVRLRRFGAIAAAAAIGLVLASVATEGAQLASTRSVGAQATLGVSGRVELWEKAISAAAERPFLGWGPGRFEAAVSPKYTQSLSGGGTTVWKDAHNLFVEYAVTTGALGLGLLLFWLGSAARAMRGPLAGFAAIVATFMLVQPQTVGLTPLVLLALGASSPATHLVSVARTPWRAAAAIAGAVGAAAAAVLLAGQFWLRQARLDTSVASFDRGHRLAPPWPDVSQLGARVESFHGLHSPPHRRRALALAREATRRDPADSSVWSYLGMLELKWGTDQGAERSFHHALERNPWNAQALLGEAVLAERRDDGAGLDRSCRCLRELGKRPKLCRGARQPSR